MRSLSLLIILSVLVNINTYGKELHLKSKFGEDLLLLPRQIVCSSGEIYILDEGDKSIKVFSQEGELKKKFGRKGIGPGEFISSRGFFIHGENIYVLDVRQYKLHIFSKKDNKYLTSKRYSLFEYGFQPYDFVIADNGLLYYTNGVLLRNQKVIVKMDKSFKPLKGFLDAIPVYNNINEAYSGKKTPKVYLNLGYIAIFDKKIYFSYWLLNIVYEFSMEGELLNKYTLPLESIDETVKIIRQPSTGYNLLERRLNYDILARNNQVYVLSRDGNGSSFILELREGKFVEKYRTNESLYNIEISNNKLYGIERDEGLILVYDLK